MRKYRVVLINLLLSGFSLLLTLACGEIFFRSRHELYAWITLDSELGWKATPNQTYSGPTLNRDGSSYYIDVSQDARGFRKFSNVNSSKLKLFVVGDSFTQAEIVSDDATYYSIIGEYLGLEVFAYGLGGGGTLQEYMIFNQYFDEISPDIILWQYCSNDFINNSYSLESQSKANNNGLVRPYWENNNIVYRIPKPYPQILSFIVTKSSLLQFLLEKVYVIQANNINAPSAETEIEKLGFKFKNFREAYQTTDQIMGMVRQKAGNTPIFAFNCQNTQPYYDAFKQISKDHNIHFIDIHSKLAQAEQNGVVIVVKDGAHWNQLGHSIVGETIAAFIQQKLSLSCTKNRQTCQQSYLLSRSQAGPKNYPLVTIAPYLEGAVGIDSYLQSPSEIKVLNNKSMVWLGEANGSGHQELQGTLWSDQKRHVLVLFEVEPSSDEDHRRKVELGVTNQVGTQIIQQQFNDPSILSFEVDLQSGANKFAFKVLPETEISKRQSSSVLLHHITVNLPPKNQSIAGLVETPLIIISSLLTNSINLGSQLQIPPWPIESYNHKSFLWLGQGKDEGLQGTLWSKQEQKVKAIFQVEPGLARSNQQRTVELSLSNAAGTQTVRQQFDQPTDLTFIGELQPGLNTFSFMVLDESTNLKHSHGVTHLVLIRKIMIEPEGSTNH